MRTYLRSDIPLKVTTYADVEALRTMYRPQQKVEIICLECGNPSVKMLQNIKETMTCHSCNIKLTKIARYGTSKFNNRDQAIKTNLERHGVAYYTNMEQTLQTKIEKYGVKSYNNPEKNLQTQINTYGKPYLATEKGLRNFTETMTVRYGVSHALQVPQFLQKTVETRKVNAGSVAESYAQGLRKQKDTCRDRFGGPSPFSNADIKQKIKRTCLDRYGVENPQQSPNIHKKSMVKRGMSVPEKKILEFLTNRGFEFEKEYSVHEKIFDFAIFKNGKLSILLEIDGEYHHGLLSDYDGHHVQGQTDFLRFQKTPDEVKFLAIDSHNISKGISEILRIFDIDYEAWQLELLNFCRSLPFPYPNYPHERLCKDYQRLVVYDRFRKHADLASSSIRQFHKSIWDCNVKGHLSPKQAYETDDLLKSLIQNRIIYGNTLSTQDILRGFTSSKIAPRVSAFSPSLAKYLVEKYLQDASVIFDPFSGFSGRLLGTCASGKYYIGQDVNINVIQESQSILEFHNLSATLHSQDIFQDTPKSYEALFTCPPYSQKEYWPGAPACTNTTDDWITYILNKYSCKKYLIVGDTTIKYAQNIVEEIENSSHFGVNKEKVILITN